MLVAYISMWMSCPSGLSVQPQLIARNPIMPNTLLRCLERCCNDTLPGHRHEAVIGCFLIVLLITPTRSLYSNGHFISSARMILNAVPCKGFVIMSAHISFVGQSMYHHPHKTSKNVAGGAGQTGRKATKHTFQTPGLNSLTVAYSPLICPD